jgi:ketosteroid isomerase-like protein
MSNTAGSMSARKVAVPDGRNQFWIADGAIPDVPARIDGFDVDNDVIVMSNPGLSRSDLRITQDGDDTTIRAMGSAVGREGETVPLAILSGVHAADLDPEPLLRQMYAALGRGDIASVLDLMADDVSWEVPGPQDVLPWAGRRQGREGVAEFFDLLGKTVEIGSFTPQRFIAQGNTVAAVIDDQSASKATGLRYQGGVVQWITVRGGKIKAMQYYMDTFPIVEAFLGGRPFTLNPTDPPSHYVAVPVPGKRSTDSIIFDPAELEVAPAAVQVVRRMYAALQALDVPRVREVFADDVLWDIFGPPDLLSWAGPRHGPDAAAESAAQIIETMKFDHFKPTRSIYQGDTVAVVIDEGGISKATGQPFSTSVVHVVRVNPAGRVDLFRNYINTMWIVEAFLGGRPVTVR